MRAPSVCGWAGGYDEVCIKFGAGREGTWAWKEVVEGGGGREVGEGEEGEDRILKWLWGLRLQRAGCGGGCMRVH